jgi:N-acetylglucosaminyldiphosphoundecaprenol N-acetyl-beta-D-mannosaminyltransferase
MRQLTTEKILDYAIAANPVGECVDTVCRWIEAGEKGKVFVCANPHSLVMAEDDPVFKAALRAADLATPDGVGIVLASKMLGGHIRERVTGSDVFEGLSRVLNSREGETRSYFFLGSTEATLAAIKTRLAVDFPKIRFAGCYSPPFKEEFSEEDSRQMVEAVNRAGADVLWVGMTAPKQEKWIFQHKDRLEVKFIGAIGAAFDFYAGTVKRSHPVFQKMGLEWLPRLLRDPRRLYDRMLVSAPKFVGMVVKQGLRFRV